MVFKTKRKKLRQSITIKIHDQEIKKLKYIKFLGLYIDDELSWKYHIDQVTTKISKMTGIMAKARHYLSIQTLKTLTTWCIHI